MEKTTNETFNFKNDIINEEEEEEEDDSIDHFDRLINAMKPIKQYKYIDHYFDIDSSNIYLKSNKNRKDEYVEVKHSHAEYAMEYFTSINYNRIAIDAFTDKQQKITNCIATSEKQFYVVEIDGVSNIFDKDIIPKKLIWEYFECNIKKDSSE